MKTIKIHFYKRPRRTKGGCAARTVMGSATKENVETAVTLLQLSLEHWPVRNSIQQVQ